MRAAFRIVSRSEAATRRLGQVLGRALLPGVTVLLSGDLGAGKTAFVKGVGDALGVAGVRSPSFTLINEYRTERFLLAHADLYRLDPEGVDELGLEEYAGAEDAVLMVEWPERWRFPPGTEERVFEVRSVGERADEAADALFAGARDCPGAELL